MKMKLVVGLFLIGAWGWFAVPGIRAEETPPDAKEPSSPLAEATRVVVRAIVQAAERNQQLPARGDGNARAPFRLTGDELTAYYIREAAAAARKLPPEHAVSAYLIGLGLALDDSLLLRKNPVTADLSRTAESDAERRHRLGVLGSPTLRGRRDLAQHFVVSCALTAQLGPKLAEAAGLFKEQLDAQGGDGFSFIDLCADIAGIAFANRLRASETLLSQLPTSFAVADYLPDLGGLQEGLSEKEFAQRYGSLSDERFRTEQMALWKRVLALPGHRSALKDKAGAPKPR